VFWGVTQVARRAGDPVESLDRAWERYRGRAEAAARAADEEQRAKAARAIRGHVAALTSLAAEVAD
jgi:hypothetical protein